jgi:uncharacterized protein with NAD-binding domain and iron-sulfur cluster
MASSPEPIRVAILGGGCGAVSTAFWLTATSELRRRFAVTILTQGWRLGGKGASGRDLRNHARILEHGLHMWMGWYETAFRTIRDCYAELPKEPQNPFQSWRDAFIPQRQITFIHSDAEPRGGCSNTWTVNFPRLSGTPGEPRSGLGNDIVDRVLALLESNLSTLVRLPSGLTLGILRLWFRRWGEHWIRHISTNGYWICAFLDIALASVTGYIADVLPYGEAGFTRINHLEFKDWLLSHGANPKYIWSPPVKALYDLGFAYDRGDSSSPRYAKAAAGVALNVMLRTVASYRDAPLWKMDAGMGDTVFAPLYKVLRNRGVAIKFFHRVSKLTLSQNGRSLREIEFDRQANLAQSEYQPLVTIKGLPCWPSEPLWSQVSGGSRTRSAGSDLESSQCDRSVGKLRLAAGRDFDLVVLAIPPAGLKRFGAELIRRSERISSMYRAMSWVATRSAQIWRRCDGLTLDPRIVVTGLPAPYSSWAVMSHLIARENWDAAAPNSCEYACGTVASNEVRSARRGHGRPQATLIRKELHQWTDTSLAHFLPKVVGAEMSLDCSRIVSEYYRVNSDLSDMYVQSFPGSISYRLRPDESGITNLYLAGDWTATWVNSGCVEAAFESGRNAAQLIAERYGLKIASDDDHR